MVSIKKLNESLNRLYEKENYSLTEKVNHENDEVNDTTRRNIRTAKKLKQEYGAYGNLNESSGYSEVIMTSPSGIFSLGVDSGIGVKDTPWEELKVKSSGLAEKYMVEIRIQSPYYNLDGKSIRRKAYPDEVEVVHGVSERRESLEDTIEYIGVLQEAVEFAKQISDFIKRNPEWDAEK